MRASKFFVLCFVGLVFLFGCFGPGERIPSNVSVDNASVVASISVVERAELETVDGWRIAGDYYGGTGSVGVILVHQLNRDRSAFNGFARSVRDRGFHVLAIDLRGHGESKNKGAWNGFGDEEFRAMANDVKAAKDFLWGEGARKFVVIGASIGANTAINFGCADGDVVGIVALSPGLNYHGVEPLQAIRTCNKPVFFAVGKGDTYSVNSVEQLFEACPSKLEEKKVYESNAHGTDLFAETSLKQDLVEWIEKMG